MGGEWPPGEDVFATDVFAKTCSPRRVRHGTCSPRYVFATVRVRHGTCSPRDVFATDVFATDVFASDVFATAPVRHGE